MSRHWKSLYKVLQVLCKLIFMLTLLLSSFFWGSGRLRSLFQPTCTGGKNVRSSGLWDSSHSSLLLYYVASNQFKVLSTMPPASLSNLTSLWVFYSSWAGLFLFPTFENLHHLSLQVNFVLSSSCQNNFLFSLPQGC